MQITPSNMITPRSKLDFNDPFQLQSAFALTRGSLGSYLIALSAVQRGLKVTFWGLASNAPTKHRPFEQTAQFPRLFTITDGQTTHFFDQSLGTLTSDHAARISKNKEAAKAALADANVHVPLGFVFTGKNRKQLANFFKSNLEKTWLVKPAAGSGSKDVFLNLSGQRVMRALNQKTKGTWIIEEQIVGVEYRVYVVGDKIAAAWERKTPTVTGNGRDSIAQLLINRNLQRKKVPHHQDRMIDISKIVLYLAKSGRSIKEVPVLGKKVVIAESMNGRVGGIYANNVEALPKVAAEASIAACKVLGVPNGGVDVIVRDEDAYVLEVNARAIISAHSFSEFGNHLGNSVADAIVDYYFPSDEPIKRDISLAIDATGLVAAFDKDGIETCVDAKPISPSLQSVGA